MKESVRDLARRGFLGYQLEYALENLKHQRYTQFQKLRSQG